MEEKITHTAQELRKEMLEEEKRSSEAGEYFTPIYVNVEALWDFERKYKPKEIVSGTNDGFVFEYKGTLYGAVGTGAKVKNKKNEDRYVYKLERISGDLNTLGLAWVDRERQYNRQTEKRLAEA